jgi:hypothetical protein
MAEVVIPARFNGPPETAHGGYACAVAAQFLGWSAEVSLRRPPPLERPLEVHRDDDGSVTLLDGDAVVMLARPADLHLDIPDPVSLAEAQAAAAACPWLARHPFPTCFGCGPERRPGDGMREFPGPVAGRKGLWATPWVPDASLAGSGGEVDPLFTFSALDCPSGAGAIDATGASKVHVLGRLRGQVLGPARVEEPHVVIAWPTGVDGRKRTGGAAVFAGSKLCAVAEATWIELADPTTFGAHAEQFGKPAPGR